MCSRRKTIFAFYILLNNRSFSVLNLNVVFASYALVSSNYVTKSYLEFFSVLNAKNAHDFGTTFYEDKKYLSSYIDIILIQPNLYALIISISSVPDFFFFFFCEYTCRIHIITLYQCDAQVGSEGKANIL